ncbi:SsrA-binding protein SmpB [Viridibacillus sp. YIM B01967]|uniref:SsrA-binding protein n=1 Tax=Viridibacillus soli TaxID=2798301 RepID=A0ABS1H9C9_9BACL|nr:SsrA-binding protein SmpB [Viridibacillus soli]MBK3496027.1 SsrA-binding protein SmpB [Viridibacillus soli]
MAKGSGKVLAQNKKAGHDFFIEETIEAGMVLQGTEIKSIRHGKVQLRDSFIRISGNEAWVSNMHVSPYEQGNRFNHDPLRARKLLLHKRQIAELIGRVKRDGYTIVPLKMYIKDGYAKLLIGVGKGKKTYDKRDDLRKKEAKRDMERTFKAKNQF